MKVYIAGNITGCNEVQVKNNFGVLESELDSYGFEVLNPIRGKILSLDKDSKYECNEIVHRDLHDIKNCDILVAQMHKAGIGTSMEIMYANMRDIPIILITQVPLIANHYWIKALTTKVVPTVEEAVTYMYKWYGNKLKQEQLCKKSQS